MRPLRALRILAFTFSCVLMVMALATTVRAQEVVRFGAAGLGYFSQAKPNLQGWAALGLPLTSDGKTLSYTAFDVSIVKTGGAFSVAGVDLQYNIRSGAAYRVKQITNTWSVWALAAPGLNVIGDTPSFSFASGGFVFKDLGKGWGLIVPLTAETYKDANGKQRTDFAPRFGITKRF